MSVQQLAAQMAQAANTQVQGQQVQGQQLPAEPQQSPPQDPPVNNEPEEEVAGLFDDVVPDEPEETLPEPESVNEPDDELTELTTAMKNEDVPPFQGKIDGFDLKLPKGLSAENPLLKGFTKLASEHKAAPELVQKAVDLVVEHEQEFYKTLEQKDVEFRRDLNNQFMRQNKADPEFGGANYDASVSYAMKALRKFTPKQELMATMAEDGQMGLLEYLKLSNSHNATPLWKLLVRVGKTVSESQPIIPGAGGVPNQEPKMQSDILFGDIT